MDTPQRKGDNRRFVRRKADSAFVRVTLALLTTTGLVMSVFNSDVFRQLVSCLR